MYKLIENLIFNTTQYNKTLQRGSTRQSVIFRPALNIVRKTGILLQRTKKLKKGPIVKVVIVPPPFKIQITVVVDVFETRVYKSTCLMFSESTVNIPNIDTNTNGLRT